MKMDGWWKVTVGSNSRPRIVFALLAVVGALALVGAERGGVLMAAPRGPVPRLALVANLRSDTLSVFRVARGTGRLVAAEGSPVPTGRKPTCVAATPDGRFVYVTNEITNNVSAWAVDRTGRLQALPGSPYPVGASPRACVVDASGTCLYVACAGTTQGVMVLSIHGRSGVLRSVATGSLPPSSNPMGIALDPAGVLLFTANYSASTVSFFSRNAVEGSIAPLTDSPVPSGRYPQSVVVHPSGRFVYASGASPEVAGYALSADRGRLMPVAGSPWTVGRQCSSLVVEPTGRFAYACDFMTGEIHGMQVDPDRGTLSPLAGFPLATGENSLRALALDPSGTWVYAANSYNSHVVGYRIDGATGSLVPVGGETAVADDGAASLTIIP